MAHPQQLDFVRLLAKGFPDYFRGRDVLEVGSLDINGSIRRVFDDCRYIGLDVAPGPGVDVVCQGQNYDERKDFDVVISCEAMEHNPHWVATFKNMIRLCRPGGLVVMTCATTGRAEHGTTRSEASSSPLTVGLGWEYYKNLTARDFRKNIDLSALGAHRFWSKWGHYDLFFAGFKGEPDPRWERTARSIDEWVAEDDQVKLLRKRRLLATLVGDPGFKLVRYFRDGPRH